MIKRLSVAQKLVIILLALLISFSGLLAGLLIQRSNTDLSAQQSQIQTQYFKQYELLSAFINDRLVGFIEGFSSDAIYRELQQPAQYQDYLANQYDQLLMRWQVDELWFFVGDQPVSISAAQAPIDSDLGRLAGDVGQLHRPISQLHCESDCRQRLAVPLIADQGVVVIAVEYSMAELLASFSRSTDALVAIVSVQQAPALALNLVGQLTSGNQQRFEGYIQSLPEALDYANLYQFGYVIKDETTALLLNVLPLSSRSDNQHYLMTVTDISDRYYARRNYHVLVIGVAILLCFSFVLMVTILLRQYRLKLENLSQRLPLLAENRFEDFRELQISRKRWIEDELDELESSANTLANNLERLNHQALADQLELEKMAMFDGLTGLPNRSMLMFQLDKHIAGLKRSHRAVALMLLDLDDFKRINDSHGHGVGDSLLKAVAKRLRMQLRETDIAARFGGDEFAILLTDIEHMEDANVVATKLVEAFGQPFDIRELSFFVTVSVGIAIAGDHDISGTELLRHADIAMYEAKASKDSSYRTYDAAMNLKIMRRVELEAEAREAFQEDQFFLALQPKINIQTRRLVGFESLIRWNHPTKGPISPAEFIPVLEKTALMGKLDYWVIARSLSILSELTLNGFSEIGIAVNISAQQFLDSNLVEYLRQQLRHHNIDAHRVELELTETALVDDLSRACEVMNQVRDLGCKIAIDDFGTGYSSLTYLKAMPADVVKIDRSFVSGMLDDQDDRNIVHSTISMVRGMGITVVAEGIESTQQYQLLEDFNCHVGQGYLIARPIGQEELWETLKNSCVEGVWQLPLPQ